ncbi:hypothetical protein N7452_007939 [Penicillium brevicompactum]|uniref:Zn(2)-C6 fungal-type domain-containing protein n=1 Tax=Penicillium brevicompactum TaxID=5074 RepID=A0A9W9QIP6_PENBR|nr:hypothetical protein N7452_007939 [Penicillium brevicompactum]
MVGVPARYGGCVTCRRRKKGCDKKAPFCGQCVESGLVCEGYTWNRSVWINSTGGENRRYGKASSALPERRGGTPVITLHDSLAVAAREDRYVGLYLAAFLPNGRLFSQHASQISSAGWLRYHDELCRSEKTLRFITLAHGLSMMATRDGDSQLKLKGFEAYRMALHEMRTAVQDPQRSTGDGLLAAIRLFRFYEILYGAETHSRDGKDSASQIKGYFAHTYGEMALFMNRGCEKKWSKPGMSLLVSGRIVSFILGVGRRERSPFSDERWMTAPWKDSKKSPLDELSDILVQVPGLLGELDSLRASPVVERRLLDWNKFLNKCIHIEKSLEDWRFAMRQELRTYDYNHSADALPIPKVDRDFAVLHMSHLYWSCSILIYTTIYIAGLQADLNLFPGSSTAIPFSSPGCSNYCNERNPTLHARRIIYTLPLSHGTQAGGFGALSAAFPMGMALRYLAVAHIFPHEGGTESMQKEFFHETIARPFMKAYTARFLGHLHKEDTPAESLKDIPGLQGVELRMKRWWFGSEVQDSLGET